MAREKGMSEEMYEEFMAVVLAAQKGNVRDGLSCADRCGVRGEMT